MKSWDVEGWLELPEGSCAGCCEFLEAGVR